MSFVTFTSRDGFSRAVPEELVRSASPVLASMISAHDSCNLVLQDSVPIVIQLDCNGATLDRVCWSIIDKEMYKHRAKDSVPGLDLVKGLDRHTIYECLQIAVDLEL